jgi:hypothetical protein
VGQRRLRALASSTRSADDRGVPPGLGDENDVDGDVVASACGLDDEVEAAHRTVVVPSGRRSTKRDVDDDRRDALARELVGVRRAFGGSGDVELSPDAEGGLLVERLVPPARPPPLEGASDAEQDQAEAATAHGGRRVIHAARKVGVWRQTLVVAAAVVTRPRELEFVVLRTVEGTEPLERLAPSGFIRS